MFKKIVLLFAILLSLTLCCGIVLPHAVADSTPLPEQRVRAAENGIPRAVADVSVLPEWVRVVEDGIYLYSTADGGTRTCTLLKSYYLSVLGESEGMYFVALLPGGADFPEITGYVRSSQVSPVELAPVSPCYPSVYISVNSGSTVMRLSPIASASVVTALLSAQRMCYYGSIYSEGTLWHFVLYGGKFGYVPAADVTDPVIPLHPTPLPSRPTTAPPSDTEPNDTDMDKTDTEGEERAASSEILLIAFVVILAVGLTLAALLPGNVNRRKLFEQDI